MSNDFNVVYRISADIAGLKDAVPKATQVTSALAKSATDLGTAFDSGFNKLTNSVQRGVGTVTAELLLAQKEVKALQTLVLKNADKPGFVAALGYELDVAIPKVNALETELSKLQTGLKSTTSQGTGFTDWLGKGNNLLTTFGVGLSVGAVVAFGKSLVNDADALVKMSDRTGASIQGLQKLQVAGDDAGNTIEQMTGAINQMQNRLAQGDDSALAAVTKLGLSVEDLKAMKPDDAFIAISDAIREVPDPLEQTRIAMELFGKSGAEILPTLKRGFDDLKNTTVGMSDETVRALDAAGDAWARYYRQAKGVAAKAAVDVTNFLDPFSVELEKGAKAADDEQKHLLGLVKAAQAQIAASMDLAHRLQGPIGPEMDASTQARIYEELLRKQEEAQRKLTEAEKKANDERDKLIEKLQQLERAGYQDSTAFRVMASDLEKLGERDNSVLELKKSFDAVTKSVQSALDKIHEITSIKWPSDLQDLLKNLGVAGEGILPSTRITVPPGAGILPKGDIGLKPGLDIGKSFTMGFQRGIHELPNTILRAIEGGGSVGGAIGSTIGESIGSSINTSVQKSIAASTKGPWMKSILSGLSDLIPVVGSFVGPLINKLLSIGGPSKQELEGRTVVANFEKQFAGVEDMINKVGAAYLANGHTAEEAQAAIQRLWAAEKKGAYETAAALKEINEMLKRHGEIADAIHAEGFLSHDELVHAADIANAAYEDMLRSGQYTAEQLASAYEKYQEALAAVGGEAGKAAEEWIRASAAAGNAAAQAWIDAKDAATDATSAQKKALSDAGDELKKLIDKRNSLAEGIAKEAPEAVMGKIETQQRGELKALDGEIERKADDYAKLAKETGQEMAQAIIDALSKIHIDPLHIGVILDGPTGSGGIVAGGPDPGSFTPGGRPETSRFAGLDYNAYLRDYWAPDRNYVLSQIPHAARGGMVRDWGIEHFATGGIAEWRRGTDTVPAMLTPGEMVLTKDQQRSMGGIRVGSIAVQMSVEPGTDQRQLAEQFKEILRTDATVYEAVGIVAERKIVR